VPLGGDACLSMAMSEYNTGWVTDGEPLPRQMTVRLVPTGESLGEQKANLELEFPWAYGTSGWRLSYIRLKSPLEEAIREYERLNLEEELEEEELSKDERVILEEELEALEKQEEEEEESAAHETIVPTEIAPGVMRFVWVPPGRMTPNAGYKVTLSNEGAHAASWRAVTATSLGAWSPIYGL